MKKDILKIFAKFTGKHLRWSLFLNKVTGPAALLIEAFRNRCFPVFFAKFLLTHFLQIISRRLLLNFLVVNNQVKKILKNICAEKFQKQSPVENRKSIF